MSELEPVPIPSPYDLAHPRRYGPSQELTAWITERLRRGWTIAQTCGDVGLSVGAFRQWLIRGEHAMEKARASTTGVEAGDQPYVMFCLQVGKARAEVEAHLIDKLVQSNDDKAAMFLLERMFPADFGRREAVELTGQGGGPIEVAPAREMILQRLEETGKRLKVVDVEPSDPAELPPAAEG